MKKTILFLVILSLVIFLGCEKLPPEKIASGDATIKSWHCEYSEDPFAKPLGEITIYFSVVNTGEKDWRSFRVEFRIKYEGAGKNSTYYEYSKLPKIGERRDYVHRTAVYRKVINVEILEFYCD